MQAARGDSADGDGATTATVAADWSSGTPCEFLHNDTWYRAVSRGIVLQGLELAEVLGAVGFVTTIGMEAAWLCTKTAQNVRS